MGQYTAVIIWERDGAVFTDNRYSRGHHWHFDGGIVVPASSSPQVIPLPLSMAAAVDPEEAFVAALSSCHMLWFLSIAAKRGFLVESYRDEAVGVMDKNAAGKLAITDVTCGPGSCLAERSVRSRATWKRCIGRHMRNVSSRVRSRRMCAANRHSKRTSFKGVSLF